jgi:hypothetical protein
VSIRTTTSLWRIVAEGHVVSTGGFDRKCYNVFHFEGGGNVVDNPMFKANVAAFFNVHGWKSLATRLHSDYVPDGLFVWKMSDATDSLTFTQVQLGGGSGGTRLPVNQAVFGYTGSGLRGSNWRGSKRYGPVPSSDVVGDELTALAHTRWEAAHHAVNAPMAIFIGALVLALVPVIYSRTLSNADPTVGPNYIADLNNTYCDTTLSSWRHRRESTQR